MKIKLIVAIVIVVVMNIAAYAVMAIDKKRAKSGAWRIRERTLFLVTGLFGGLGGCVGMFHLRHKTKHWYFRVFFPVLLIVQIAVLVLIGPWLLA